MECSTGSMARLSVSPDASKLELTNPFRLDFTLSTSSGRSHTTGQSHILLTIQQTHSAIPRAALQAEPIKGEASVSPSSSLPRSRSADGPGDFRMERRQLDHPLSRATNRIDSKPPCRSTNTSALIHPLSVNAESILITNLTQSLPDHPP
jgi:hypothetical protein